MKIIKNAKIVKLEPTDNLGHYTPTYQNPEDGALFVGRNVVENTPYTKMKTDTLILNNDGTAFRMKDILPIVSVLGGFIAMIIAFTITPIVGFILMAIMMICIPIMNSVILSKSNKRMTNSTNRVCVEGQIIGFNERRVKTKHGHRTYKHPVIEYQYNGERYQHISITADRWREESSGVRPLWLSDDIQEVYEQDTARITRKLTFREIKSAVIFTFMLIILLGAMIVTTFDIDIWTPIFELLIKFGGN